MTSPAAPRYRRRPDLDRVEVWEHIESGALRYCAPGYDLNSAEAQAADALMALPPAERAQALEARRADLAEARADDDAGDFYRETLERTDLGGGLARLLAVWRIRESPGGPVLDLGMCHVFELATGDGALEIEIDANGVEWARLAQVYWPSGMEDFRVRAAALLELAQLLARPEVREALAEWAAEDAAADEAERAGEGGRA